MEQGKRLRQRIGSSRKASCFWRFFVAVLFASYIGYVPVHLAAEWHCDRFLAAESAHHQSAVAGHQDEDSDHLPHSASDHTLVLTARMHASHVDVPVMLLPADTIVWVYIPEPQPPVLAIRNIKHAGTPSPDPLQPRAPPLV